MLVLDSVDLGYFWKKNCFTGQFEIHLCYIWKKAVMSDSFIYLEVSNNNNNDFPTQVYAPEINYVS